MNAYELADRHVTDMLQIIKVMGKRGIRIDRAALDQFNIYLDGELAKLTTKFAADPELASIGGYHPKAGYKRTPKDTTGMVQVEFCIADDGDQLTDHVTRWAKKKPFVPSDTQIKEYMRQHGHAIPHNKKGGDTTAGKQLLVVGSKYKDEHYKDFVAYRKYQKLRQTYGEWPMQKRGDLYYVTTTYTLKPDTHRLSSIRPNTQNIPTDGELADAFRRCLVPSPGRKLGCADLNSAEALVTGWLAKDPDYMRLARLGIHKFAMAKFLGLPVDKTMPDDQIKPYLKDIKKRGLALYKKMKIVIYGGNYLAGPKTVFLNNPEDFESQSEAGKFLRFCTTLSDPVNRWKSSTIKQATAQKKLTNAFGYTKPFWDLPGGDAPSAVAFGPSSIIAAILKEIMWQLWFGTPEHPEWKEAGEWMVWQIHDELIFDIPEDRVERIMFGPVKAAFTQPWPQLDGLTFGCDIAIKDNLVKD